MDKLCNEFTSPTLMFVHPSPEDELSEAKKYFGQLNELQQLIELGFLKDISGDFTEEINKFKEKNGKQFTMFLVTKNGLLMFKNAKDRRIN